MTSTLKSDRRFAKSQTCEPTAPSIGPGTKIGTCFFHAQYSRLLSSSTSLPSSEESSSVLTLFPPPS